MNIYENSNQRVSESTIGHSELTLLLVKRSSSPRSFLHETTCPPCRQTCSHNRTAASDRPRSSRDQEMPNRSPVGNGKQKSEAEADSPGRRPPSATGSRPGRRRSSPWSPRSRATARSNAPCSSTGGGGAAAAAPPPPSRARTD